MKNRQKIELILNNNMGVRSGVYCAVSPTIRMSMDDYGEYQYVFNGTETEDVYKKLSKVDMMSDDSDNETVLAKKIFSHTKNIQYNDTVGYYLHLYVGHIKEGKFREEGSSGGFTTWILHELLRLNKIDGVIHAHAVDPKHNGGKLFKYVVSRTREAICDGAKTRYYPLELSQVLDQVKKKPGRYAVVGIPEFITEIRLLAQVDPTFEQRIKYTVGLVCGHQKSAKYVEALAWQHGIKPGDLQKANFRVKQPDSTAYDYLQEFTGYIDGKLTTITKAHNELFADHWPMGFFKSKFSDFTDNTFNEVADVVLGDAWLDKYNSDGMGNNIVIVRNPEIAELIKQGIDRKAVTVDMVDVDTIKQSQSGLIHHTKDEIQYRLYKQAMRGWVPKKRVRPSDNIPLLRKKVQDIRYESSTQSHKVYLQAVRRGNWNHFYKRMNKMLIRYNRLYEQINTEGVDGKSLRYKLRIRTRIKGFTQHLRTRVRLRTRLRLLKKAAISEYRRLQYQRADGAIITLPGYYNYGNMVQRFALQEFLRKSGYKFISYAKDIPPNGGDVERLKYTYDFVERNIWRKQYDPRDRFKIYIVGSDQVWRKWGYDDIFDELSYYFLDFVKGRDVKRIAYAASIGQESLKAADYTDEFIPYAKDLVQKFDYVGMRELSGVELVKEEWGVDATLVVDPTLLLSAADYDKLIESAPYKLKRVSSMFTYFILTDEPKRAMIAKIAKDAGLKDEGIYLESKDTLRPVEEWLAGIRDARLAVIDSFHGMVFSIIYHTPFVVLESGTGGASRITSLLSQLGLEDRYVTSDKSDSFVITDLPPIDWDKVEERLHVLRKASGDWLLSAVKTGSKR